MNEAAKSSREINLTKRVQVKRIPKLLSNESKEELRTELVAIPMDIKSLRTTFDFVKWFVRRRLNIQWWHSISILWHFIVNLKLKSRLTVQFFKNYDRRHTFSQVQWILRYAQDFIFTYKRNKYFKIYLNFFWEDPFLNCLMHGCAMQLNCARLCTENCVRVVSKSWKRLISILYAYLISFRARCT